MSSRWFGETFLSPSWRSLNPWKGKKVTSRIARIPLLLVWFLLNGLCFFCDFKFEEPGDLINFWKPVFQSCFTDPIWQKTAQAHAAAKIECSASLQRLQHQMGWHDLTLHSFPVESVQFDAIVYVFCLFRLHLSVYGFLFRCICWDLSLVVVSNILFLKPTWGKWANLKSICLKWVQTTK